jgi:hypothetical protein
MLRRLLLAAIAAQKLNWADHRAGCRPSFPGSLGVITVGGNFSHLYKSLFPAAVIVAAMFLNISSIHFQPLAVWARIVPLLLLVIGLTGSMVPLTVLRVIGWMGIALFFYVASGASFPSEEYIFGQYTGGPPEVGTLNICMRLALAVALTTFLIVTYRRASPSFKAQA